MNTNTLPRPRRQSRHTLPIPFLPTCAGYGLSWPSGRPHAAPTASDAIQDTTAELDAYCREECARLSLPALPEPFASGPTSCPICGTINYFGTGRCYGEGCPRRVRD